jgi:hypothetical protein
MAGADCHLSTPLLPLGISDRFFIASAYAAFFLLPDKIGHRGQLACLMICVLSDGEFELISYTIIADCLGRALNNKLTHSL